MNQALRDLILEASEDELREALADRSEDFDALAARGKAAAQRALSANNPQPKIDLDTLKTGVEEILRTEIEAVTGAVGVANLRADELRDLATELATYWSLNQQRDPSAGAALGQVRARISLILAKQDIEIRHEVEHVLLQVVRLGSVFWKAMLI